VGQAVVVDRGEMGTRAAISYRFLIGVYAAIPICLALQAIDVLAWGGAMRISLPDEIHPTLWAHAAMGTPHIIASNVLLLTNVDYLRTYRRRVGITLLWIAGFFAFTGLVPYELAFAVLGVLTIAHVFHQQMGIGKGVSRCTPRPYAWWTWTGIVMGAVVYNMMYLGHHLARPALVAVYALAGALLVAFLGLTVACHRSAVGAKGKWFLWANAVMLVASAHFFFTGWFFLAALAPRIIHDTTAFAFYVVHDHNRHEPVPKNLLYRLAAPLRLGTYWVAPAVAILLTVLLQRYGDAGLRAVIQPVFGRLPPQPLSLYAVVFLTLMHYSTEAVTWKKGSPYRTFVPVTV
jgi:hypothetical protein